MIANDVVRLATVKPKDAIMSATGLDVFDRTIHLTNTWLDEMMTTLPHDKQLAWHALGTVLRTIRDRIPVNLAAHLGAQLPLLIRGLYYDQWRPSEVPKDWRSAAEFLGIISAELSSLRPIGAGDAAQATFRVLNHHLDPNQVEKVRHALPEEVRALWVVDHQQGRSAA